MVSSNFSSIVVVMFQLLGITKFVLVPILAEWLSPLCLLALDSAYCNRKNRVDLIDLIKTYPHQFKVCPVSNGHIVLVNGMMDWLIARDLQRLLINITISKSVVQSISNTYFDAIGDILCSIRLERFVNGAQCILGAIQTFTNLQSFSCCRVKDKRIGQVLEAMSECCHRLRSIEVSHCDHLEGRSVSLLCRSNPDLICLRINLLSKFDLSLCIILPIHCRKLEVFDIDCGFTPRYCSMIVFHCSPSLSCLDCLNCASNLLIAYRGLHLKSLNVSMEPRRLLNFRTECPRLTSLTIVNANPQKVFPSLPSGLTDLQLPFCQLTTDDLLCIGQTCEGIERLTINVGSEMSPACFERLPRVTALNLLCLGSPAAVLHSVIKHCKNLTSLELQEELNDAALLALVLQSCPLLVLLDVEMGSPLICKYVAENGARLQTLKLRGLLKQAVNGMIRVLKECRQLRTLHCTDSSAVKSLLPHIAASPRLTELNLKCSDYPVCTLAEYLLKMPRLSVLIASLNDSEEEQIRSKRPDLCVFQEFS